MCTCGIGKKYKKCCRK
ncbi:hypothetical protein HBE96_10255 [Clostridium sp. P21]|uniref:Uncharacterized protein n=1 Tax=Clostridium muellerianum TaxID=2716538 RepID=A0A7Y0HNE5_9CLOT|nr:hypothetical protein [Clostridium muellerianum]